MENFICEGEDVNAMTNTLTTTLLDVAKAHIPNKSITVHSRDKPWFNNNIRKLISISYLDVALLYV